MTSDSNPNETAAHALEASRGASATSDYGALGFVMRRTVPVVPTGPSSPVAMM